MFMIKKEELVARMRAQALEKQNSSDRRRRLEGRLDEKVLAELVENYDTLPESVKIKESKNGYLFIHEVLDAITQSRKNLRYFVNNPIYIQTLDTFRFTYIKVLKATCCNTYKVKTDYIINKRVSLEMILNDSHFIEI